MERLPFVSVLLPVFNGKAHLAEALESVQRQTYKNFEIISIDDGSHDGSFDVLKSASLVDSRIRVSRQSNRGIAATTNALFAAMILCSRIA